MPNNEWRPTPMAEFEPKSAIRVHVTAIVRIKESINKAEDTGTTHEQIRFADALRRVLLTTVARVS